MPNLTRAAVALLGLAIATHHSVSAQETATWYIPTYSYDVLVWDEASEQVVDRITMANRIPNELTLNEDRDRIYVLDATKQKMEVIDLPTRTVVDAFSLTEGNVAVRIDGFTPDPSDEHALIVAKRYTKGRDRYTIEGPFLLEYDLRTKTVTDTLEWPDGKDRDRGGSFRYSPDGSTLYFFGDDVFVLDAETYEELDRWELSRPLEPGLGRSNFSMNPGTYDAPGEATGIFRMTDPIHDRSMLGIAQVDLADRDVDFYTLGEAEPVRQFALGPGGTKGYALYSEIGRYEFWEFDLENRSLVGRHPFAGRPRMGIQASADGEKVYVYVAGNTIDIYDADSFELLRTVAFDEDMTLGNVIIIPGAPAP